MFSTLHDHLKSIHRACATAFGISGRKTGFYIGATTKGEKNAREREKVKPVLFTTFAMMSEGTTLDWIDTCILGHAAIERDPAGRPHPARAPDKAPPVVMDIVDEDSPVFNAYAAGRLKWYRSIGCQIKDMT